MYWFLVLGLGELGESGFLSPNYLDGVKKV